MNKTSHPWESQWSWASHQTAEQWHPSTISEVPPSWDSQKDFSPNPPEFCKLTGTEAGKGGKAGGMVEWEVSLTLNHIHWSTVLEGKVVMGGGFGTNGSTTVDTTGSGSGTTNRSGLNHIMRFGHSRLLGIHHRSIWTMWTIRPFFNPMFFSPWLFGTSPHIQQTLTKLSSASRKQRNRNSSTGSISTSTFPLCPTWTFWGVEELEPGCKPKALTSYPGPKASWAASRCWV